MERTKSLTQIEKLSVLMKAIELGAQININFHKTNDINSAYVIASKLLPMLGTELIEGQRENTGWLEINSPGFNKDIEITIFYKNS